MTTVPSSAAMIEPWLKPAASGMSARIVAIAGHQDRPDAGPAALDQGVRVECPSRRSRSTRSSSTIALVTTIPMSIRKPMSALMPIGPAGQEQRREGADRRERQAEQDDERRDQRVEREDHHQVDEQDRDAHRGEQAAERLVLLLRDARQLDGHAGRDLASGLERVLGWTPLETAPVSSLVISAVIVAAGDWSIRVMLPWTSACSTSAIVPSATLVGRPHGQLAERSTEFRPAGSSRTTRAIGSAVGEVRTRSRSSPTSAVRTSPPTWAAVSPTPIALFGSTVTWISGVAFDEVALEVEQAGCSPARPDGLAASSPRRRRVVGADDDAVQAVCVAGRLRHRDVVAVRS